MSLVHSTRLNSHEPHAYLTDAPGKFNTHSESRGNFSIYRLRINDLQSFWFFSAKCCFVAFVRQSVGHAIFGSAKITSSAHSGDCLVTWFVTPAQ